MIYQQRRRTSSKLICLLYMLFLCMLQSGVAWHVLGPHNMVWRDVDQVGVVRSVLVWFRDAAVDVLLIGRDTTAIYCDKRPNARVCLHKNQVEWLCYNPTHFKLLEICFLCSPKTSFHGPHSIAWTSGQDMSGHTSETH
jgi:hypothetical protein